LSDQVEFCLAHRTEKDRVFTGMLADTSVSHDRLRTSELLLEKHRFTAIMYQVKAACFPANAILTV
jgi:hypothetical protein